jgi:hypothetical protein
MPPGRIRNSLSPLIARMLHIVPSNSDHWKMNKFAGCAHLARCANFPCSHLKNHNRPWPHLAAFYPAIGRSCMQHSFPPTQGNDRVRQTAISETACRGCGSTIKLPGERRYCAVGSVWRRTRKGPSVAICKDPGSAARTKPPTGSCANTFPKAPICPYAARQSCAPSRDRSTNDPANARRRNTRRAHPSMCCGGPLNPPPKACVRTGSSADVPVQIFSRV